MSVDTLEILKALLNIKGIKIVPAIDDLRNYVYIKEKNNIIIVLIEQFVKKLKKYKINILIIDNPVNVYNKILSKELGKFSVSLQVPLLFPKAQTLALMAEKMEGLSYKDIEPLYGRKS